MFGALEAVIRHLASRAVPSVLIGAAALAARGVLRSTDDVDLLVTERTVLQAGFWEAVVSAGFGVEVRVGDDEDPLAGVARITREPARAVDVVVGRHAWQAELIQRAERHRMGPVEVGLVTPSDLILLKLFAGGRQDVLDVESLLEVGDRRPIEAAVDRQIGRLPAAAREAWAGSRGR